MPFEKTDCGSCGASELVCPKCECTHVTPMEAHGTPRPDNVVAEGLADVITKPGRIGVESLSEPEQITYKNLCWECGYTEAVTVTFERTIVEEGSTGEAKE